WAQFVTMPQPTRRPPSVGQPAHSEFCYRTSLPHASCRSLSGVGGPGRIRSALGSHVCGLERPANRRQAALGQNFHGPIDTNMNAGIGSRARALQPFIFRMEEGPHVVLVIVLQTRRFKSLAQAVFHCAAAKPIWRSFLLAFCRSFLTRSFFGSL